MDDTKGGGELCSSDDSLPDSDVLVRVKGASLDAALLLTATVASLDPEPELRFMVGRVVLVPLAVRVVVDPSAFLT
jgi:hypothetical protein